MTIARQVVAGLTLLISRRCTQRQLLLRPEPMVEWIYLYCLGEAVARFGMTLHGFIAMSNHQHLVVRDNHGNFPEFLAHLHKMIAKAMNRLRHRCENFWSSEQPSAVRLVEPGDRFDKLVYLLANPVADDLVDRLSDWPGASSFGMHLSGRTRTIQRPKGFFRNDGNMPPTVSLRIERPEGFEDLSDDEWLAKLKDAVLAREETARAKRRAQGKGVLGRKAILNASPTDVPRTEEPRGQLRPQIACRNAVRRNEVLRELAEFRAKRTLARIRFQNGERDVVFPEGTYRIRWLVLTPPDVLALSA